MSQKFSTFTLLLILLSHAIINNTASASYSYVDGGASWSSGVCSSGTKQSPINLEEYLGICDDSMTFYGKYSSSAVLVTLEANDYYRYFNYTGINYYLTDFNGTFLSYTSSYAVFRNPSEHKIKELQYDVEMQVVSTLDPGYTSNYTT